MSNAPLISGPTGIYPENEMIASLKGGIILLGNTASVRSQHSAGHIHENFGSARVGKFLHVVPPALRRPAQVGVDGDTAEEGDLDQCITRYFRCVFKSVQHRFLKSFEHKKITCSMFLRYPDLGMLG